MLSTTLAKGPRVSPVVTGLPALASLALVVTGCSGKIDVSLRQACADYTKIFRGREAACYDVAPEPNESVLQSREIESCALSSGALGSQVGESYWETCALAANNDCAGYECAPYPPGTRQTGEPCLVAQQCASLFCRGVGVSGAGGSTLPNAIQCGACSPRLAEGVPCNVVVDACEVGFPSTTPISPSRRKRAALS